MSRTSSRKSDDDIILVPPPAYTTPPPRYVTPPPAYTTPPPRYITPPPRYITPPPAYTTPPPTYPLPPPTYPLPPPAYQPTIDIPIPIKHGVSINIYDMYVLFEIINKMIYTRCKTKNIFLKQTGYHIFSLEIKYKYDEKTNNIIYFSLKDNNIYFQIYKYDFLLYYIFLKITSVLINYKTYVYVYNNSQSYITLFTIINIISNNNLSPIYSILNKSNKQYFDYLIENNIILKKNISDGNNIHITTLTPNDSITLDPSNKYIIDNKDDLHILKIYKKTIIESYLMINKNINIFFNTENMILDDSIKTQIERMPCQSKRKKIRLSKTHKHKPLSFEKFQKKHKSLGSITRKKRSTNTTSLRTTSLRNSRVIPSFNNTNINIGLLVVSVHGGIIIQERADNVLQLPVVNIPVRDTKLYYKSITLPGYYNYFLPEKEDVKRSFNSEENDYEYVGDSLLSDIESVSEGRIGTTNNRHYEITLGHYRNIFERCFKKNPLKFYEIFYSCGNKIINKFLRGMKTKTPNLRPQDKKIIDYSKLNKTKGPGPINTILDKVLEFGSKMNENTKITFIVFNNSSKQFERYNLSDVNVLTKIFGKELKTLALIMRIKMKAKFQLSSLIEMVLTYKYGLDSLYVYDTSCSSYDSGVAMHRMNDINRLIDELPNNIGR
jgi:hypothetical protein